ncbi:MAG: monovalent cation/H(+) antiporter subunit G [Hyphomicrobiaceae bacterium]|nr:monovalent cation/H(+) antiporter subunit G [Hyphomicrobiaceae bacterium]
MDLVIEIASWGLILTGSFFIMVGAVGMNRMPDVFTRMHAASVIDTTGAGFLIFGLILQAGFTLVAAKLVFILLLFFFTGPVVSHALAQAALTAGVEPILADDRRPGHQATPDDTAGRAEGVAAEQGEQPA